MFQLNLDMIGFSNSCKYYNFSRCLIFTVEWSSVAFFSPPTPFFHQQCLSHKSTTLSWILYLTRGLVNHQLWNHNVIQILLCEMCLFIADVSFRGPLLIWDQAEVWSYYNVALLLVFLMFGILFYSFTPLPLRGNYLLLFWLRLYLQYEIKSHYYFCSINAFLKWSN